MTENYRGESYEWFMIVLLIVLKTIEYLMLMNIQIMIF